MKDVVTCGFLRLVRQAANRRGPLILARSYCTAALIPLRWVHLLFVTQMHEHLCLRLEGGQTALFRRSSLRDVVVWFHSHSILTYFDVTLQACLAKILKNYQTLHGGDFPGNYKFIDDHTLIFLDVFCVLPRTLGLLQLWG